MPSTNANWAVVLLQNARHSQRLWAQCHRKNYSWWIQHHRANLCPHTGSARGRGFQQNSLSNLLDALANSKIEPVEDARFLSAFGIPHLGIGESRRLLQHHSLDSVGQLTAEQIDSISGFGVKTSGPIAEQLQARWSTISHIKALGFQLNITPRLNADGSSENAVESPISGKTILFTGEMSVTREEMQAEARALGAVVRSSVSGRLKILVIGDAPSQSKLTKATNLGVQVLREAGISCLAQR